MFFSFFYFSFWSQIFLFSNYIDVISWLELAMIPVKTRWNFSSYNFMIIWLDNRINIWLNLCINSIDSQFTYWMNLRLLFSRRKSILTFFIVIKLFLFQMINLIEIFINLIEECQVKRLEIEIHKRRESQYKNWLILWIFITKFTQITMIKLHMKLYNKLN